ncbi:MAG: DNA polymerase [Proteobacteria bacterium]|nr:DNA polymerase [Pseudomonadota bacterium]
MTPDPLDLVRWLYLDMNSYFASVEQEMDPKLRGKPVAVVPLHTDTTVCIAVSYEGKAFGVKTGTMVGEAKRLCPKMIFVDGDHRNYIRYHHRIVEAVETCLPIDSVCSIDEIACRLSGSQQDLGKAEPLAMKVKAVIRETVGESLKCSIGLGPNRYLAKIAADMKKPDGFTVLRPCDLPRALYGLKLRDLTGIGPKMELRLHEKHVYSMERLCAMTAAELNKAWGGVRGEEMWHLLRGEELPEKPTEQKTLSHSHVLPPDLRHEPGAYRILKKLTVKTGTRLRKEGFYAAGLQIFAKFTGEDGWHAHCGLVETQDTAVLLDAVRTLWKELPSGSIYAVGVVLTGLVPETMHAPSLFEDMSRGKLLKTMDSLNEKYGKDLVHYGAVHESGGLAPLRIAFTRIPDEKEG